MTNNNPTFKWLEKQESKGLIKIDTDIKDSNQFLRGVYGFFIENTCIYVGKSRSMYSRIFDSNGYLANLKYIVENKGINHEEKLISNDLFDAIKKGKQISILILERVPLQFDHHSKDMQRLASAEYKYIDYYQQNNQCLNQLPEGNNMSVDVWNKLLLINRPQEII